jgi:hypothetical protein
MTVGEPLRLDRPALDVEAAAVVPGPQLQIVDPFQLALGKRDQPLRIAEVALLLEGKVERIRRGERDGRSIRRSRWQHAPSATFDH